jgi:hypothetical protein
MKGSPVRVRASASLNQAVSASSRGPRGPRVTTKVTTRRAGAHDYYSFENLDTGEWQGLLRFDPAAATYEWAGAHRWEPGDPERVAMFLFPGSDAPERIDRATAERLARRYGVALQEVVRPCG